MTHITEFIQERGERRKEREGEIEIGEWRERRSEEGRERERYFELSHFKITSGKKPGGRTTASHSHTHTCIHALWGHFIDLY